MSDALFSRDGRGGGGGVGGGLFGTVDLFECMGIGRRTVLLTVADFDQMTYCEQLVLMVLSIIHKQIS